jgi:polyisoprenoid-binding protein YceI
MAWIIDSTHTQIEFSVKHMMITTVRGRFTKFNGTVKIDEAQPERSYVEGTIEAASLDTHEPKRDEHLRSADFFDATTYPELAFRSTAVKALDGEHLQVTGDLTIRGVTRPVTFDVTVEGYGKDPWGNRRLGLTATASVNRKDFGLNWNVALEAGGWLVGDVVKINADLELIEKVEQPAAQPEAEAVAG